LESLGDLIDELESPYNRDTYSSEAVITEILAIPQQIADEIFQERDAYKPEDDHPLKALRSINERQLAQINPIPIGTGFLVGGSHLMTNNHVIPNPSEAVECVAQFNYEKDRAGVLEQTVDYELDPNLLFVTDPALDYTLVQLKSGQFTRPAGYTFGWLQLVADESNIAPGIPINEAYDELNFLKEARYKIQDILEKLNSSFQEIREFVQSSSSSDSANDFYDNSNKIIRGLHEKFTEEVEKIKKYVKTNKIILIPNEEIEAVIDLSSSISKAIVNFLEQDIAQILAAGEVIYSTFSIDQLLNDLNSYLNKLKIGDKTIEKIRKTKKMLKAKKDKNSSIPGDRVLLVQHPKGREKQLVQNDNRVLPYNQNGLLKNYLRYTTASDYGSSGSPVFNSNWELVALHHAAIAKEEILPEENATSEAKESSQEGTSAITPPPSTPDEAAATDDSQSQKPTIEAYQGVRICRIVEDLQQKSRELPKLKSFIEDFVVTTEQLNYLPMPVALGFSGTERYVSIDNNVAFLTASLDGSIKLWSRAGIELKTLQLAGTGSISALCLSSDGQLAAIARSPQTGERSRVELWEIQAWGLPQEATVNQRAVLTSEHPLWEAEPWNVEPKIGNLSFSEDDAVIAAISIDGYIDIWSLDGSVIKSVDILQGKRETNAQSINSLTNRVRNLQRQVVSLQQQQRQFFSRARRRPFSSHSRVTAWPPTGGSQLQLRRSQEELSSAQKELKKKKESSLFSLRPFVHYYPKQSIVIYGRFEVINNQPDFFLEIIYSNKNERRFEKDSGYSSYCFSPDGEKILLIKGDSIEFWDLNSDLLILSEDSKKITENIADSLAKDKLISNAFYSTDGKTLSLVCVDKIIILDAD
jgi:WD40 repeat protein